MCNARIKEKYFFAKFNTIKLVYLFQLRFDIPNFSLLICHRIFSCQLVILNAIIIQTAILNLNNIICIYLFIIRVFLNAKNKNTKKCNLINIYIYIYIYIIFPAKLFSAFKNTLGNISVVFIL